MDEPVLRRAEPDELDPATLYALLRLRVEVFVVEQSCPYQELDGRDLEPTTVHFWLTPHGRPTTVLGYLRLLAEPDDMPASHESPPERWDAHSRPPGGERAGARYRIGRVCTAPRARGAGLSRVLVQAALDEVRGAACVLDAQSYLTGFYASFGFRAAGEEFLADGIPHVPMRRDPSG